MFFFKIVKCVTKYDLLLIIFNISTGYLFVKAEDVLCLREVIWRAGGADVAHRRARCRAVLREIRGPTWASGVLNFIIVSRVWFNLFLSQCFSRQYMY